MTGNQLTYWANIERERANRAAEAQKAADLSQRKAELAYEKVRDAKNLAFEQWKTRYNKHPWLGEVSYQFGIDTTIPKAVSDFSYGYLGMDSTQDIVSNFLNGLFYTPKKNLRYLGNKAREAWNKTLNLFAQLNPNAGATWMNR